MVHKYIITFILCSQSLLLSAQTMEQKSFIVGEECPSMSFKDALYTGKKEFTLSDFKGKWLILDFFSIGCSACFESLPKLNELRKEFSPDVEVLMVGRYNKNLPAVYERFRKHYNLDLPLVYDSLTFQQFSIRYVPLVLILDPNGIIRGITYSVTKANIQDFLDGKHPGLPKVHIEGGYDSKKPLLIDGNGGRDTTFLYRSILTRWENGIMAPQQHFIRTEYYGNRVQVVGVPLLQLYHIAYTDTVFSIPDNRGSSYGTFWKTPILEVSDSSEFVANSLTGENMFNYSLIVPRTKSSKFIKRVMQNDLNNYFGYSVKIEKRAMPYWKLTVDKRFRDHLVSRANAPFKAYPARTGFCVRNSPVEALIWHLFMYFQDEPPFVDETGLQENIGLDVDAIVTDFNAVRKALEKQGFKLEKAEKEMRVVVIRDKLLSANSE